MRICFISRRFFPAISGMSIYASNLLRELVAAGHDVTMISQYRGDEAGRKVYGGGPPPAVPGVTVIGLEQLGEQQGGDFERDIDTIVRTVVTQHRIRPFDVLHAQYGYPTGWAALLASRETGIPNVVSIQGGDGHWVGSCCETHRLAMVRVLDHAGALLIGGRSFAEEVRDRLGTPMDRFTFVPGAVDTHRFTPGGRRESSPVRILYHGRVDRRKGVLDFLASLKCLDPRTPPWLATISGIGPDLESATAYFRELKLQDRVAFTGYAAYDDVPAIYREHDVFVSPTYAEGFSNTILEAMASGLAVLSCRTVGVVDCVRDGENGVLVEAGNVAAQSAALERLIRNVAWRSRLAEVALAECRRSYSWESVARLIIAAYQQVCRSPPDLSFSPDLPMAPCRFRAEPHLL